MWACIVTIAAGLWVMISPSIISMSKQVANINHICGPLLITFAVIALWDINKNVIKANLVVAAFLVVATMFLIADVTIIFSNILSGVIAIACSLIKRKSKQQYGGGWRSLFQEISNE